MKEVLIEAVVFDMDGILFDTERLSAESWFEAAQKMGLGDITKGVYSCIGRNHTDCRIFMKEEYGEDFPYEEFHECNGAIFRKKVEQDGLPVMKGAPELLKWLKEKDIRTALASSSSHRSVKSHLERAGFTEYFQLIIGGDMVEHSKPQPDIYRKACALFEVEPGRAAAIEDSPNGIRAAHGAGMLPIMVPDLVEPTEEIHALLYRRCENLTEVLEFFKEKYARGELLTGQRALR